MRNNRLVYKSGGTVLYYETCLAVYFTQYIARDLTAYRLINYCPIMNYSVLYDGPILKYDEFIL